MRLGRDARVVGATLRLLPIFPSVRMAPPSMVRHACLRPLHPPSLLMTQPEPYDDAVKALRTQLQLDPSDASLHFEMAGAQMRLGKTVDAACSLRRSISLGGVSERLLEAYHEIAEQLMREGVCEEAESCWRQCLEIEPHNLGVKERLAATLRANGNRLEAADHLHDLIGDLDGSEEEQSWMYLDLGSVIDEVSPLAGVGPEWVEHCERGSAEVQSPTLEVGSGTRREELSAEACFRRAIQLDPSNGEAHKRLADLLVLSHGPRAAHAEFEIASQLLPDDICCATHCFYASSNQSQSEVSPLPLMDAHGSSVPIGEEGLSALIVPYDHDGWAAHAASTFEQHGAVVLNQLLSQRQVEVLLDAVNEQITCPMSDFTSETRNAEFRVHKALPVHSDACDVLNDVLLTLWPLLSRVLQSSSFPLIGSGFMCVGPGASEQELHKDVHGHDRHRSVGTLSAGGSPRAVSIQLQLTDTTHERHMGSLELLPGSHRPDAAQGCPSTIELAIKDPHPTVVPVAVPTGTVTLYSSRLWHRGSKNLSCRNRVFCFLTVMEANSPAPPGLIHTACREDVGKWAVSREGLISSSFVACEVDSTGSQS